MGAPPRPPFLPAGVVHQLQRSTTTSSPGPSWTSAHSSEGSDMTRMTVIGATGFVGSRIAREAAARGHAVTGLSRNPPAEPLPGVTYVSGSVTDQATLSEAISGAEVV